MKPGLLTALLASMSVSSLNQIEPDLIHADQVRLLEEYTTPELRDFIGDALAEAKEKGSATIKLRPRYQVNGEEMDLKALSLIYSGATGTQVSVTNTEISVLAPKKNKVTA